MQTMCITLTVLLVSITDALTFVSVQTTVKPSIVNEAYFTDLQ